MLREINLVGCSNIDIIDMYEMKKLEDKCNNAIYILPYKLLCIHGQTRASKIVQNKTTSTMSCSLTTLTRA
jgi:hypothetical protein